MDLMNSGTDKMIHDYVEKTQNAESEHERKKYAKQANKIHEKATGHSMSIDSHGNIATDTEEAKQCPALK